MANQLCNRNSLSASQPDSYFSSNRDLDASEEGSFDPWNSSPLIDSHQPFCFESIILKYEKKISRYLFFIAGVGSLLAVFGLSGVGNDFQLLLDIGVGTVLGAAGLNLILDIIKPSRYDDGDEPNGELLLRGMEWVREVAKVVMFVGVVLLAIQALGLMDSSFVNTALGLAIGGAATSLLLSGVVLLVRYLIYNGESWVNRSEEIGRVVTSKDILFTTVTHLMIPLFIAASIILIAHHTGNLGLEASAYQQLGLGLLVGAIVVGFCALLIDRRIKQEHSDPTSADQLPFLDGEL